MDDRGQGAGLRAHAAAGDGGRAIDQLAFTLIAGGPGFGFQAPRTVKDVVTLVLHTSPDQVWAALADSVDYYRRERCHEALKNVTPDDVPSAHREATMGRSGD